MHCAKSYAYWRKLRVLPYIVNELKTTVEEVQEMQNNIMEGNEAIENERLRFALNAAGIGTWDLNPITQIVQWDSRCRELFGFAPNEVVSYQEVLKYMHPDDVERVNDAVQKSLSPDSKAGYEVRYRAKGAADNVTRWILSKGKAYFDDNGVAYRFAGTAQDITDLMEERERAAASEQKAQIALDNSNSGYFRLVLANDDIEYSPGYARVVTGNTGLNRPRTDFIKAIHIDDLPIRAQAYEVAAQTGKLDYEVRVIWDNGTTHWMRVKGTYLNDNFGKPYILTGTVHDVTAEVKQRSVIEEARQLISTAFDNTAMCMAFTDEQGRFTKVNDAFCALVGYSESELKEISFKDITHPDDFGNNAILFNELVTHNRKYFNVTKRYIHRAGNEIWAQCNVTYVPAPNGDGGHVLAVARDITADVNRENELAESEARFRGLIEQAPVATCLFVGKDMVIEVANEIMLGYWGKGDAVMGKPLAQAVPELIGQPFLKILDDVFTTGVSHVGKAEPVQLEVDGALVNFYFNYTYKAIRNTQGEIYAVTNMAIDVTREVESALALAASEAMFRNVTNSSPTGLWLSDEQGGLTYLNKTLVEWTGMPYADLLGAGWADAIIDEDRQRSAEAFMNAIETRTHYDVLFRIKKFDDSIIWCRAAGDPYYREDGSYAGYAGFCMDIDELVSTTGELRSSEARFRSIVEQATMGIGLMRGRDMRIEVGNDAIFELWGKTKDVAGMCIIDALPEIKGQGFLELLENVYDTGKPFHGNSVLVKLNRNGVTEDVYFDFTYTALRGADNSITGVMVLANEVTEQVQSRHKLEESELFSRSIFQHSPVAKMVFTGAEMVIKTVNSKMQDMLGRDESIIGLPFLVAVPEFKELPFMGRLLDVFKTGETYYQPEEKVTLYRYGGLYTGYYNYIYKALRNVSGEIYGVMVTAVEITGQVLARQKIEEAETTLRGAIELAELGTWEIDLTTGILQYSPRLRLWFGFTLDEVITTEKAFAAIREDYRPMVDEGIRYAIKPGSSGIYDLEYYVDPAVRGTERILHAQGKTFYNEEGKPYKISGTVQDVTAQRKIQLQLEHEVQQRTEDLQRAITELNEANGELLRSNEELAQYAYVASHDLQEPLRKIMIFADMLKVQQRDTVGENPLLDKIGQATTRMSLLIKDLLEFSRLVNSDSLVQRVDLNKVVNAIAIDFELVIGEKKATIQAGTLPEIEGVGLQMNQLFYNLLNNALKFTKPDVAPAINITARLATADEVAAYIPKVLAEVAYYHITFSDNGIGFEMEHAERIFEIFRRLHGKSAYAGSGIGLALCRRIVTNHNGALYAESTPGNGATFHIILPEKQR